MPSAPERGVPFKKDDVRARAAIVRARAAVASDLEALRLDVTGCTACTLCADRQRTVFADGDGSAGVLFVGWAPGSLEEEQGKPFLGRSGKLLTDIIEKGMGLPRSKVMITNVHKCRPAEDRDPTAAEAHICSPWLERQIELSGARVVVPLGERAAGHLLRRPNTPLESLRGQVHRVGGYKVIATYDPALLLEDPSKKRACWADIQRAMAELGLGPPGQRSPK